MAQHVKMGVFVVVLLLGATTVAGGAEVVSKEDTVLSGCRLEADSVLGAEFGAAKARMTPADLFQEATTACGEGKHFECYVMFCLFANIYPSLVEGLTNAGVALEQLQRSDDAVLLYKYAMQEFPDQDKPLRALVNILEAEVMRAFTTKSYERAARLYMEIIKLQPALATAWINLGNIYEQWGRTKDAQEAYASAQALDTEKGDVRATNAMCRLLLLQVTGPSAGHHGLSQVQRLRAFQDAKRHCSKAVEESPEDATANMNIGLLYKHGLEFRLAVEFLKKANRLDKTDLVVLSNLAGALSRLGEVEQALIRIRELLAIDPTRAAAWYSIGTMLAPFNRSSVEGMEGQRKGIELHLKQLPRSGMEDDFCTEFTPQYSWMQAPLARLDTLPQEDVGDIFGMATPQSLSLVKDSPLVFSEKQTFSARLEDVYVEGLGGIIYDDCNVYLPLGASTDVPRDFRGSGTETVKVEGRAIHLLHQNIHNHYHWVAEVLPKLLIAGEMYKHVEERPPLLLPKNFPGGREALDVFGYTMPILEYEVTPGLRYHFDDLQFVHWEQVIDEPDQNDLWSNYLPSRYGLRVLKHMAAQRQSDRHVSDKLRSPPVIYVSRKGVREVLHETILIEKLQQLLGENLYVFKANGGSDAPVGLQAHMDLFEHTSLIIGPHGAGLVNMAFSRNASVAEFKMRPQCNRCFGYMAMALGLDYWLIPEVTAFYHTKYEMTEAKADTVAGYVGHILRHRGQDALLHTRDEL